jgi:hypothetical protein
MTERPGYLSEFIQFWSAVPNVEKIWMSLFTPQIGENSYEILPRDNRMQVIRELLELREQFPKLAMPPGVLKAFADPPSNPQSCIFAKTTTTVTADLTSRITPCQFGGTPDCRQCGCMASAGLKAVGDVRLPLLGIKAGSIYNASLQVGSVVARMRKLPTATSNGSGLPKAG